MSKEKRQLVSIIIPVYNVEKYIKQCIDSAICQAHSNVEIILIDDGSSDRCGKICDEYSKKDARVKVIHKKNGGVSSARNCGLKLAKGEYVAFLDGDDLLFQDSISTLLEVAETYNADYIASSTSRDTKQSNLEIKAKDVGGITTVLSNESAEISMLYQKEITNGPHSKLIYRQLLKKEYFREDITIAEDLEYNSRILRKARKVCYVATPLYMYRLREGSALASSFKPSRLDEVRATDIIIQTARTTGSKKLLLAAINRNFMSAVLVAFSIDNRSKNIQYVKSCNDVIRRYRRTVALDPNSRLSYRVLAVSALINVRLPISLVKLKNYLSNKMRKNAR